MARRNGNRVVLSRIPNAMGWIYREVRDIPKAIEYDRMSAETAQQMKLSEAEAHALINLGHDYAFVGETGLAMTGLQDAERLLERDPWYRWRFFDIRLQDAAAQVCLRQGQLDEAHSQATHLLVNATRYEAPKYMALARNALAEVAFVAGEYERAATEVRTGLAGLQRHPAPLVAWKSWGILGRALGYLGDNEGARQAFAESAAIVKTILANIDDQSLCAKFLNAPDVCAVFAGKMK